MQNIHNEAEDMLKNGQPVHHIEQSLIEHGLHADEARNIIRELSKTEDKAGRDSGLSEIALGVLTAIIAILITIGTGDRGIEGGIYIVTWVVFAFGIWRILKGVRILRGN